MPHVSQEPQPLGILEGDGAATLASKATHGVSVCVHQSLITRHARHPQLRQPTPPLLSEMQGSSLRIGSGCTGEGLEAAIHRTLPCGRDWTAFRSRTSLAEKHSDEFAAEVAALEARLRVAAAREAGKALGVCLR